MKVLRNTLEPVLERWSDPGDYPNALAAGPLPDGPLQLVGVDGELVLKLDKRELSQIFAVGFDEFLETTDGIGLPDGVLSVEWQLDGVTFDGPDYELTISCVECEADPDYCGPEPPDHEDY